MKPILTTDEEVFRDRVAVGMETGAVRGSGDLRIVATLADDTKVALQLPQAWLHGEGGLAHFIRDCCTPDAEGTVPRARAKI